MSQVDDGFETHLIGSTYRVDFASDDSRHVNVMRALGCALMTAMPESGIDDAVHSLFDAFVFAAEDDTLPLRATAETTSPGLLISGPAAYGRVD